MTTGVPGLDTVLSGGLPRGSTTILQGPPGAGKTVLANQIAFHHISSGGTVLYITLLAESHTRLLGHLRSLTFFNASVLGQAAVYLSGYQALRENLTALLTVLQRELIARRPSLLVVDGLLCVQELYGRASIRQFLHELQVSTETANCTSLLLSANLSSPSPEDAVADGVLFLAERQVDGVRHIRELQVHKVRGSAHLGGRHAFIIDQRGLTVFPRIEALYRVPSHPIRETTDRVGFDDPGLDAMLGGGLRTGSSTLLLGPTGTGKTLMGLSFLAAGLKHKEVAAYSGFYEPPDRLLAGGHNIGLRLAAHIETGRFRVDWRPPVELHVDAWADRLLQLVRDVRPRRLFIDGLNAVQDGAADPDRIPAFLTAVSNELRGLDVTTMWSSELHPVLGRVIDVPLRGVSQMVENTILLRYAEVGPRLHRLLSVLKVREAAHETDTHEYTITSKGVRVSTTSGSAEAILSGRAPRRRGGRS